MRCTCITIHIATSHWSYPDEGLQCIHISTSLLEFEYQHAELCAVDSAFQKVTSNKEWLELGSSNHWPLAALMKKNRKHTITCVIVLTVLDPVADPDWFYGCYGKSLRQHWYSFHPLLEAARVHASAFCVYCVHISGARWLRSESKNWTAAC